MKVRLTRNHGPVTWHACFVIKDGAYFCYCSYVLPISRYSGFLWVVPTNTGIFLRGFKAMQRKQNLASAKIGGNHAFFSDNKDSERREIM